MPRIRTIMTLALLTGLASTPALAQTIADLNFRTTHLNGTVSHITSRGGGNLAVCAGDEGLILIDSEFVELHDKLIAALAELAPDFATPEKPDYVINTHWHFDHCGGNEAFGAAGTTIIAHENVRTRLAAGQLIGLIDYDVPPAAESALPTEFIADTKTMTFNGETIVCTHMPHAHTDGDVVVRFVEANVVHTGDLVFFPGYPFIDISSGGNVDGIIAGLTEVLGWCDDETRIIPGHGPVTDKAGLTDYVQMLKDFRAAIAGEIEAGKDLEAIKAGDATAAVDEKWDGVHFPSAMMREMVWLSLTSE